jgi:hypothetical protein
MVINLDLYRTTKAAPANMSDNSTAYGDEILNASWNPVVPFLTNEDSDRSASLDLPKDLSKEDVEAMLERIYGLATQI